jgi:hypothetical protein
MWRGIRGKICEKLGNKERDVRSGEEDVGVTSEVKIREAK